MDEQALRIYKTIELFDGLTHEQFQALYNISQAQALQEDEVLFDQGEEGDKLFIIRQGQVEISVQNDPTLPAETKVFLGQGQIVGEIALIDHGKRSATVRAISSDTEVDVITREAFEQLCADDKAIGYVVMRNLAIDLAFKLRKQNLNSNKE